VTPPSGWHAFAGKRRAGRPTAGLAGCLGTESSIPIPDESRPNRR